MDLQCNSGCDNFITKQEIINLINNAVNSNNLLFIGAIVYVTKAVYEANFDSTGLGIGSFSNWALANGNNGTDNWTGKMPVTIDPSDSDFNVALKTGGHKEKTVTIDNLPDHSHVAIPPTHTHEVNIPSHNHTATAANALSSATPTANGGSGSYSVSGNITFNVRTINSDNAGATAFEVLVSASDIPDTTEEFNLASGSVVLPNHSHTVELGHGHVVTVDAYTGETVTSTADGNTQFNTSSVGGGLPMNVMNPYVVAIPIQRIA